MSAFASRETLLFGLINKIYNCKKIDELKTSVLDGIYRLIPYQSAAFFLVNPESMQYKDPVFRDLDPGLFYRYAEYYESKDIYKKEVFSRGMPAVDRSSDYMEYRRWEKNEHRTDFLLPQGIYNIACLQIVGNGKLVGEVSLHRNERQPDFSNEEMEIINVLHEPVSSAFTRFRLQSQRDFLMEIIEKIHLQENAGYILMDSSFNIINYNKLAASLFDNNADGKIFAVHLREQFRRLIKDKGDHLFSGLYENHYEVSAFGKIKYRTAFISDRHGREFFLTLIENVHENVAFHNLSRCSLTRREKEIAELILRGKSNFEICRQLYISENTLKTHIKQLYNKLNVKNRAEMAYRVYLGKNESDIGVFREPDGKGHPAG